jgi:hypothetical protein
MADMRGYTSRIVNRYLVLAAVFAGLLVLAMGLLTYLASN